MATKTSKTTVAARKSAKKAAPKTSAPRKRVVKAAPAAPAPEQPAVHDAEPVRYVHRGNTYELERTAEGYIFSGQTFKSLAGFGKYLAQLDADSAPADEAPPLAATETDALLDHVETTLAKPPRQRKTPAAPKERKTSTDPRLAPGTTLTRMYKGQEIKVEVTTEGFVYEGQTFKSISAVAKHIVGYMISGPVFFRLVEPKPATAQDGQ